MKDEAKNRPPHPTLSPFWGERVRVRGEGLKVALVHDWLTGMRGGEKVLEVFCGLFPSANIYTLLHIRGSVSENIENHKIYTSCLQKLPFVESRYRYYLPMMPSAIEAFELSSYDLVISSSHCVAKGAMSGKNAPHVCYCFTPMRYIWDQYENYFGTGSKPLARWGMKLARGRLQKWDRESSGRVTDFIAISKFVAERIKNFYGRESAVIYPPVDTGYFTPPSSESQTEDDISPLPFGERVSVIGDFYLIVSALAPYKRIELAVQAFNLSGKKLKIIGSGPEEKRLKNMAKANIEFLGWKSDDELRSYYRNCRALLFPGVEDFGIAPLEAMSCGRPVIAFGKGGALETVLENVTGVFFYDQNEESMRAAVEKFEGKSWDPSSCRENALRFNKEEFLKNFTSFLNQKGITFP